jgi:aquaporin Z
MKLLAEFVGTFLFLFTIAVAVPSGSTLTPLAIGGALMVMVFAGGHVSGAHYNPAVSLAVFLRGKMTASEMAQYWGVQIVAGILAFMAGGFVAGRTLGIAPAEGVDMTRALLNEALFTFMLATVVLNVATVAKNAGNSFYGLAIGFTIVCAAIAGGAISGGAYNPAVGIGATVAHAAMGGGAMDNVWIYIVGPLAGALLAGFVFKAMVPDPDVP